MSTLTLNDLINVQNELNDLLLEEKKAVIKSLVPSFPLENVTSTTLIFVSVGIREAFQGKEPSYLRFSSILGRNEVYILDEKDMEPEPPVFDFTGWEESKGDE